MKQTLLLLMLLLTGVAAGLQTGSAQRYYVTENQTVEFISEAPLERIHAHSEKLSGILDLQTRKFLFQVPMESFYGFNSPLQREHFNENYMESDQYPKARFDGKIIEEIDFSKNGTHRIRAKGKLYIHGMERRITVPCKLTINDETMEVSSSFSVQLSHYGIKIPRVVSQKLSEVIDVQTQITMRPKNE